MTTTELLDHLPATPADVVELARDVVRRLEQTLWAAQSPSQLLDVAAELERLRSTVAAVESEVVVEIDACDAAKGEAGYASVADFVTAISGGRRSAGSRLLRTARGLTGEHPSTLAALHAGTVSPEQAEVIVKVLSLLPVDAAVRERAEAFLLVEATMLNATELEEAGNHLLEVVDPDGVARREERKLSQHERSAHLRRFLSIVDDGLGGVQVRGRGTVEDAAVIKSALASLSAPLPNTDPECGTEGRDERDHGARLGRPRGGLPTPL